MKKDELVVVGYTSQRKVDLTGSVAVVSTDDLKASHDSDPMRALQGKIPGMTITSNGFLRLRYYLISYIDSRYCQLSVSGGNLLSASITFCH